MAKKQFTMESNLEKITQAVEDNPKFALNEIGRSLVNEIRPQIRSISSKPRNKFLASTLQYWVRPQQGDLLIGYKNPKEIKFLKDKEIDYDSYKWKYDKGSDPIKSTILKNVDLIHKLMGQAMASKESRGRPNFKQEDTEA